MRKFKPIGERRPQEKEIERDHRTWATKAGWFVEKIMKAARDGFPDRFYARCREQDRCHYCGRGRVILMEWKRFGEEPEPIQEERIRQLREAGVEVYVVDSVRKANRILGLK